MRWKEMMPVPLVAMPSPWITPNGLLSSHSMWLVECLLGKNLACFQTRRKCLESGALSLAWRGLLACMLFFPVQYTYRTFWMCPESAGCFQLLSAWQRTRGQHTIKPASTSATAELCKAFIYYPFLYMMDTQAWISSTPSLKQWTRSLRTGGKRLLESRQLVRREEDDWLKPGSGSAVPVRRLRWVDARLARRPQARFVHASVLLVQSDRVLVGLY